jgi:hypothetical protein
MDTAEEALKRIEIHEAECRLMREMIERRLDSGQARFDRLERMMIAMYPFVLAAIAAVGYFS